MFHNSLLLPPSQQHYPTYMALLASFTFCFLNKNTLTFHSDGPIPFSIKQLTTTIPQIPADVDLSGQTVLITGANSGVGFESAKSYVKHKARVIFGVRNLEKGETAAREIREEVETAEIKVMKVDMESFESIKSFVEELERTESRVDIAVLNAGISQYETSKSPSGYDVHLQVRVLSKDPENCKSLTRSPVASDKHTWIDIPRPSPPPHPPQDQNRAGKTYSIIVHFLRSSRLFELYREDPSRRLPDANGAVSKYR